MKKIAKGTVERPVQNKANQGNCRNLANELCFRCIYATGGCEWSDHFRPVEGWTVEKGKFEGWLHIIDCPQYEEGDRIWSKSKATKRNAKESSSTS